MLIMKLVYDFKEEFEKPSTLCVLSSCRHVGLLPQSTSSLRGETASISLTVQTSVYHSARNIGHEQ